MSTKFLLMSTLRQEANKIGILSAEPTRYAADMFLSDPMSRQLFSHLDINWDNCRRDLYEPWKGCYEAIRRDARYTTVINGHRA